MKKKAEKKVEIKKGINPNDYPDYGDYLRAKREMEEKKNA